MTRTFIALEMHEEVQRHLEDVIRQVARALPAIRWVKPESIHLTLAFLGELDDEQLAAAQEAVETAAKGGGAFSYRLGQPGIFGSIARPRVVWLGIEEQSGMLTRLHRQLQQELARRDFKPDARPFSPHFTLARVKDPLKPDEQQQLRHFLDSKRAASQERFQVRQIEVIKSELFSTGAVYTRLKSCPLGNRT
jgi:2'-5' RNA ligase